MPSAHITVTGYLAREPELRTTPNGAAVLELTVPVNNPKNRDDTAWYRCSIFGKRAEALSNLGLTKGTPVAVFGKLTPRTYQKDGQSRVSFDVLCDDVELTGKRETEPDDSVPF